MKSINPKKCNTFQLKWSNCDISVSIPEKIWPYFVSFYLSNLCVVRHSKGNKKNRLHKSEAMENIKDNWVELSWWEVNHCSFAVVAFRMCVHLWKLNAKELWVLVSSLHQSSVRRVFVPLSICGNQFICEPFCHIMCGHDKRFRSCSTAVACLPPNSLWFCYVPLRYCVLCKTHSLTDLRNAWQ